MAAVWLMWILMTGGLGVAAVVAYVFAGDDRVPGGEWPAAVEATPVSDRLFVRPRERYLFTPPVHMKGIAA